MALPGVGNCRYTPLQFGTQTGTATVTVNPGPATNAQGFAQPEQPTQFSVFYGVSVQALGTNTTTGTGTGSAALSISVYDLIPPTGQGTNTATVTNLLANATVATLAAAMVSPGGLSANIPPLGVRYYGALVAVATGATTLGSANCLWD